MGSWHTKDSGERAVFESGMHRDTEKGKVRYDLLVASKIPFDEQFLTRVAGVMTRGAEKYNESYTERNWEKACTEEELARMRSSAFRHFMQWMAGEEDEDHAAAVVFNLLAHESTKYKMEHGIEPGSS